MLKTRLTISNRANQKLHLKIRSAEAAETEHCQVRWRKALKLAPGTYFVDCCYPAAHLKVNGRNGVVDKSRSIPSFCDERYRGKQLILDLKGRSQRLVCEKEVTVFDVLDKKL